MKLLNNQLLKISFPPLLLLAIHVLVTELGIYEKFWWFDIPMHFLGGVLIAISVAVFLNHFKQENKLSIQSVVLKILFIISLTALFAVSWEILEFFIDQFFNAHMQASVIDTMKDLSMGIIGGNVIAISILIKSFAKDRFKY